MSTRNFNRAARGPGMCLLAAGMGLACVLMPTWMSAAAAQDAGCCEYTVRTGGLTQRRCADLSREQCTALKSVGSFLKGLQCDGRTQRCARRVPTATATPSRTRTSVPSRTPTPRAATEVHGCCQIDSAHRPGESTCGNDIVQQTCEQAFRGTSAFCEHCACSSHSGPGFSSAQGVCIRFTPTPTRTPTATPQRPLIGCCQLDNLRRVGHPVCGNTITQQSCFADYAGDPSFCLDCACSSHGDAGFTLDSGVCVTRIPTPTRTPTPAPRLGCCELDEFRGGHLSLCGNQVSEASCMSDTRGVPRFCPDCVCSSHTEPGFGTSRGSCISRRRVPRPHGPHIPRPPRSPR